MARTMSVPCRRDLACFRNDGHAGDHAYATPDTVPSPAPIWQAGYDAGYREAQEDIAYAAPPSDPAAPLDVERLALALRAWRGDYGAPLAADLPDAADLARCYAEAVKPDKPRTFDQYAALTLAPKEADRE